MTAPALVLTLSVLSITLDGDSGRCSLEIPIAAGPDQVVVLAMATGARIAVDPAVELPRRGWWPAVDGLPSEVWGQQFEVLEPRGATADPLFVVPWEYDPACHLRAWSDSVWVPAGDTVVFTLSRGSRSASRPHTYHVLGWHAPYPTGELIPHQFRGRSDAPALPARDYFEMLAVLPADEERRGGSGEALERFRAWAAERQVLDHFPVNEIVWFWERQVRGGR